MGSTSAYQVARAHDRLGQTVAFSLAYLLTLIVCQIARAHYFMIWFPMVMFACLWLISKGPPAAGRDIRRNRRTSRRGSLRFLFTPRGR
jgi:hypothetical protein